jgi:histidinol-phosphatase (PHP family)
MIPIDQHVHLEKGPYSLEWLDSFIRSATDCHVARLGIVEHTTQFRALMTGANRRELAPGNDPASLAQKAWFERHMNRGRLCEYTTFIKQARERYPGTAFGLEVDWFGGPMTTDTDMEFDWDFLIGSVHFIEDKAADNPGLPGIWGRLPVTDVYIRYFELLRKAVESRTFDILGHLDVLKMVKPLPANRKVSESLDRLIDAITVSGITVETNTAFSYRHEPREEFCPSRDIIARLGSRGVPLTLSSDAHRPEDVGMNLDKAAGVLKALGVKSVRLFHHRKPKDVPL